ncbi:MAG: hypothetical protein JWM99_3938 [Verrucomicrobiales bacterium]|jgi:hypothetical protein|nr:hypothetical protein [Verrucomicrobiales bacterium]
MYIERNATPMQLQRKNGLASLFYDFGCARQIRDIPRFTPIPSVEQLNAPEFSNGLLATIRRSSSQSEFTDTPLIAFRRNDMLQLPGKSMP